MQDISNRTNSIITDDIQQQAVELWCDLLKIENNLMLLYQKIFGNAFPIQPNSSYDDLPF